MAQGIENERRLDPAGEEDRRAAVRLRTVFDLPASHRRRLRTTNLLERVDEEIKRRTRVARLFPYEASCLRLVSAILMEISDDWQTADKRCVVFDATIVG